MKRVVVLVNLLPATERVKMDPERGTVVRTGLEMVINPLDLYAVEEAVRMRERYGENIQITALTMGPPAAADAVREAIAMGCTDGVHLCEKPFAGADTWATAYALSQAVKRLGKFDLVLCGERATDGETGQVGPMVGAMLGIPVLTYVSHIEVAEKNTKVIAHRAIESGHEIVESPLPAMVSVVKEINQPRLPTLRGKMLARKAEVPVWGAEEILERIAVAASQLGGAVSGEHGIGFVKRDILAQTKPLEVVPMRRLKEALDPSAILNPGKLFNARKRPRSVK